MPWFGLKKEKNQSKLFRIHITYFLSGLTDAAATQFPHFPQLDAKLTEKRSRLGHRRLEETLVIRTRKTPGSCLRVIPSPSFPSLVAEKKVTAEKPLRDWRVCALHSPADVPNNHQAPSATLTVQISEDLRSKLIMTLQIE